MSTEKKFKLSEPYNWGEALKQGSDYLRQAGKSTPQLDARVIVCNCCSLDPAYIIAHPDEAIPPTKISRIEYLISRRAAHEPVAYITGKKEFWGRNFLVDRRVLIPRPETETLIEATLPLLEANMAVLDVGTGSGCIAVTLALEAARRNLPLSITGMDISPEALEVARKNADLLEASVEFVSGDIRNVPDPLTHRVFNLIVSNPPYVASRDISKLEAGVRDYEPPLALDGGPDGLEIIREILQAAENGLLAENGLIIMEIGAGQAKVLREVTEGANIRYHSTIKDLAGVERVALFMRQP